MKKIGFCGLPNVGKSTFLKLITKTEILIANYPFTTTSPKLAKGYFISDNLLKLHSLTKTNELIPAHLNFLDVPGLIRGSHKGLGLGNEFLSYLRQTDVIFEIVRNFKRNDVVHSEGEINPERDILLIEEEIIQSEKRIIEDNLNKLKKQKDKREKFEKLLFILNEISPFRRFPEFNKDLSEYNLLLTKDWFLIINGNLPLNLSKFKDLCFKEVYQLDFQFELELQADQDLQKEIKPSINDFLNNFRIKLNLIEFFTFTKEITQSWLVEKDTKIIEAAKIIHTDFAQKFKTAEVVELSNFISQPDWSMLKNKALIKQVGKNYCLQESDIIKIII